MQKYSSSSAVMKVSHPGESKAAGEDDNLDEPEVEDQPGPIHISSSPSHSLSSLLTTVSELGVEQGKAFLKVKKLKVQELNNLPSDPEVVSSGGDDKSV